MPNKTGILKHDPHASQMRGHEIAGFDLQHLFFFSSRRRHTRCLSDWSSDVCSSDLKLTWKYDRAEKGNIFQAAKLGGTGRFTLALGFGASAAAAVDVTKKSLGRKFAEGVGRAACRGRGENSVVGGSFKKKKKRDRTS